MNKIVVIGGTGILGKSLKKINNNLICLGSDKDIFEFKYLEKELDEIKPDIIINAAAIKSENVNKNKEKSINVNIIGSANIAKYCLNNNIKLVYISTDYVYRGTKGNYNEFDDLYPKNLYAWTKLAGEVPVRMVEKHQIIRTSFGEDTFPYEFAYDNLFTSKDYVDIISKLILDVIEKDFCGIINVGTERKSIYEYATRKNKIEKKSLPIQEDYSLDTNLYYMLVDY